MPAALMKHETDPKTDLIEKMGPIGSVDLFHNYVMVAIYLRPKETKSGIILPDQVRDEDNHQGKVGLIVKQGDSAFQDPTGKWTWPDDMGLHQWVYFRASDGWGIKINGQMCRILADTSVRGRVDSPDQVF